MLDDNFDDILKVMIENVLDSTSGNIDRGKLETFMLRVVDKMRDGKPLENDVKTLLSACCKLWREKEGWKRMYYDMADRYNKHLDEEIARYNRMLGRRG
jgi:hypothetical protein